MKKIKNSSTDTKRIKKKSPSTNSKKVKITLVRSGIDRPERQKLTLQALGLNKLKASKEVEATPQILGMIRKVTHLVEVEDVV